MLRPRKLPLSYRMDVAARMIAAAAGAYAAAALIAMSLARILPFDRSQATIAATMLGVLAFPAVVVGIFAARTAWRAWLGLTGVGLLCLTVLWLTGSRS